MGKPISLADFHGALSARFDPLVLPVRVPVSDGERAAFHEGMVASGVTTTDDDIDDVFYW